MTAPDPTSLLSQAEAAIAARRETEGQWWISDGQVRGGGEKILGPFASRDLALNVRRLYEAHSDAHGLTFWVSPDGLLDPALAAATDHAESVLGRHAPWRCCEDHDFRCRTCAPGDDYPCPDARDALGQLGVSVDG